jgi:carboxylate-amine ligase
MINSTLTDLARATGDPADLALEVREELLLFDPCTGHSRDMRPAAITATGTELVKLRGALLDARRTAAAEAADAGAGLVAVAVAPVGRPRSPTVADFPGLTQPNVPVSGLHVDVAVPGPEFVVPVSAQLQVWLPVVRALSANSPVCLGVDTGYASWYFVESQRRAMGSLGPRSRSTGAPARTAAMVRAAGAAMSQAMLAWHARPCCADAAVEIRAGDVCLTVDDTILVAALLRGAAAVAVDDARAGRPATFLHRHLVQDAHWEAARDGLTGTLTDLRLGRPRPAWELVDEFFAMISPALLANGDLEPVVAGLARLREAGTGAERQRRAYAGARSIPAGLAVLAEQTTSG